MSHADRGLRTRSVRCGSRGQARGTVARRLAYVPVGWRPTQLVVRGRRFACTHCCRVWRQEASTLAEPRVRLTRLVVEWRLRALGCESVSVSWVAAALGVAWYATTSRGPDLGRAGPQRGVRPVLEG